MKKMFLVCLFLLVIALAMSLGTTLAQCSSRTDWTTYTVQRGDTLASIARRFNTTPSELVAGNCLPNANRILVGQVLVVPVVGANNGAPLGTYVVTGSYQSFDHGFMLWFSDSGFIYALAYNTTSGPYDGTVWRYPLDQYGALPNNPVTDTPPPGHFKPILGFGKVWGNFAEVRTALGWANAGEQSYRATIYTPLSGSSNYSTVYLPDNREVAISNGTVWNFVNGGNPLPQPTATPPPLTGQVRASFQPFEKGYMLWRSDNGTIYVLNGTSAGILEAYTPDYYSGLPDNPVRDTPPAGRVRPILGFGKVWGNNPLIRQNLGWATSGELSYTMMLGTQNGGFTLSLPTGQVMYGYSWMWNFLSSAPTATPQPAGTAQQVKAAFQSYDNGFMVWTQGSGVRVFVASNQQTFLFDEATLGSLPDNPVADAPPAGRVKPINAFGRVWGSYTNVRALVGWATGTEQGYTAALTDLTIAGAPGFSVTLPDGRKVVSTRNFWNFG